MSKFGMSLFAGLMLVGAVACDDGVADTAGNASRCQQICNAVDECTGDDNSTDCRKECTDKSEEDGFEDKAEDCAACIERDNSCAENVVQCGTECAGVVALSQ